MKKIAAVIFSLAVSISAFSQGSVEIIKDSRIDDLIRKQGEIIPPATGVQISGFRVQVAFESEKNKIDAVRLQFAKSFPKVETYITYTAPNYFLRVGDFRTKAEAERFKAEIMATFPAAFIVQEMVNLPRID